MVSEYTGTGKWYFETGDTPPTWSAGSPAMAKYVSSGNPVMLVTMAFTPTPVYLTDSERPITHLSNTHIPFPFLVSGIKRSTGPVSDTVEVSVSNVVRSLSALFMEGEPQGKTVHIYKTYVKDGGSVVSSPFIWFSGMIDDVSIGEAEQNAYIRANIKNDFIRWDSVIPRNSFSANCNWIFKSTTPGCQYTGVESLCNKGYNDCIAKDNVLRFRGFRHMVNVMEMEIWWGKVKASGESGGGSDADRTR